jgi:protein SCO1/2
LQKYKKATLLQNNKNSLYYLCGMLKMSKKFWMYIGFFAILLIGFWTALVSLIPDFGKKKMPPISYVRPFAFVNQDGNTITEKDLAGKVYVAEFFFTTCKGICPIMNTNMRMVHDEFKNEKGFAIVSHTSDPDIDSPAVLKRYADSMQVSPNWIFLTGRKDSLYKMARVSYVIDNPDNNLTDISQQFLHTQNWALVDKKGDVRKVYDGLKKNEVKMMIADIKKLLRD